MSYSDQMYTSLRKEYPRTWRIWYRMCKRCELPQKGYAQISVDENWDYFEIGSYGFLNFIDDMGPQEDPKLELDRINVLGDYEKSNCRWTTRTVNNNNKRWHQSEKGKMNTLRKRNGINRHTYYGRLERGWDPHDAATMPPNAIPYKNRTV